MLTNETLIRTAANSFLTRSPRNRYKFTRDTLKIHRAQRVNTRRAILEFISHFLAIIKRPSGRVLSIDVSTATQTVRGTGDVVYRAKRGRKCHGAGKNREGEAEGEKEQRNKRRRRIRNYFRRQVFLTARFPRVLAARDFSELRGNS